MRVSRSLPARGRTLCALLGTAALAVAVPAAADNTASPSGLMKFKNVQVVNGTPEQVAAAQAPSSMQQGMRAFVDPVTGQLREPTAEEAAETGSHAKSASARASVATAMMSARGSMVIQLDDSFMMNSIVKRDAAGKLHAYCIDGHQDIAALLRKPVKEVNNER